VSRLNGADPSGRWHVTHAEKTIGATSLVKVAAPAATLGGDCALGLGNEAPPVATAPARATTGQAARVRTSRCNVISHPSVLALEPPVISMETCRGAARLGPGADVTPLRFWMRWERFGGNLRRNAAGCDHGRTPRQARMHCARVLVPTVAMEVQVMSHRRTFVVALVASASLALPHLAVAQSAFAGVVRDTSGAVLPGVTVEASSPALIEKVRSGVTNEAGQYRIVDLRPGTYTVSFKLPGFNTVVRENIELETNFTAPINIEMRIGSLEETLTVTGESPVVDVQTSHRREVVSQELIESLPTGRNFQLLAGTVPAVSTGVFDVGGSSAMWTGGSLLTHGSQTRDSRTLIDGMVADAMFGGGQCACIYDNEAQTQEIAVQVSGGSAENQTSGVLVNRIPKTGGNEFRGEFVGLLSNSRFQGSNIDNAIRARGIQRGDELYRLYDANYSMGGPIIRDRVWFFVSGRNQAYNNYITSSVNPDGSVAQVGTRAEDDNIVKSFPGRITAQLTQKDRMTVLFDWANKIRGHRGLATNVAPQASDRQTQPASHIAQAKWTSARSSKLLIEAGYNNTYIGSRFKYRPEVDLATCVTAFVACAPGTGYGDIAKQDLTRNVRWNASLPTAVATAPAHQPGTSHVIVASVSYVTGAHNVKVGIQNRSGWLRDTRSGVNGDIVQQYRNGAPSQVLVLNTPLNNQVDLNADFGAFAQDTWTTKRLSISPGIRFDYFNSSVPEMSVLAGRFVPARTFAEIKNVPNWKNVSPRLGAAYDLFGNGKTAIKGNIGLYVQSEGTGFANTYNPQIFATDTRTWSDTNRDDIAQESELGPSQNLTFGTRRNVNADPSIDRPTQWVSDLGIQQELLPGLAVAVSYNRRSFHNVTWRDNLAVAASDYTLETIPDPRGNGQTLPLYNLARARQGLVDELDTTSSDNGRIYNGVDVSFNWRVRGGATVFGGTSTGRTLVSTCQVEDQNALRFCNEGDYAVPFATQFKLSGTYPGPLGIRVSASFQSQPGTERTINYQVTPTIASAITQGRVVLTQPQVNVRLNEPGTAYNDRVNQLDMSLSRTFRSGRLMIRPELSLFNMLNANPVLTQTNVFGTALGNALTVLPARLLRFGINMDF
jgi:hypothetical protein